jgi:hypothetical protein
VNRLTLSRRERGDPLTRQQPGHLPDLVRADRTEQAMPLPGGVGPYPFLRERRNHLDRDGMPCFLFLPSDRFFVFDLSRHDQCVAVYNEHGTSM